MSAAGKRLGEAADREWWDALGIAAASIGLGAGIAVVIATLLYFLLSHRWAGRFAAELHVEVDGDYLRIRQHACVVSDRKIHFRSIVDHATTHGPLMRRFGMEALQMTTMAGGQSSLLFVPGVKECAKVRDMLSEIDSLRER
jgi:membrane protein YdbS with pleckstrin-like domain